MHGTVYFRPAYVVKGFVFQAACSLKGGATAPLPWHQFSTSAWQYHSHLGSETTATSLELLNLLTYTPI